MENWMKWAMEIQSLAQAGLSYTDNVYDIERYERLREIGYFALEEIPDNLAEEKTNKEQIEMCFKAFHDKNWQPQFD